MKSCKQIAQPFVTQDSENGQPLLKDCCKSTALEATVCPLEDTEAEKLLMNGTALKTETPVLLGSTLTNTSSADLEVDGIIYATTKAVRCQRKHAKKLLKTCTKDTRQSLQYGLRMLGQARDRLMQVASESMVSYRNSREVTK